jgi:hypothetical protein
MFELKNPASPEIEKNMATAILRVLLFATDVISDRCEFAMPMFTTPATMNTMIACANEAPGNNVAQSINSKNLRK